MTIYLKRIYNDANQTFGILTGDGFVSWVLEDEPRIKKVSGETRIPAGTYKLAIRKQDTPLTIKHRVSYWAWFKYHIEITGVPNFTGIYIHSGNDQSHTDGCLLLGNTLDITMTYKPLTDSTPAVKRFYDKYYPLIDSGEDVFITITDN